MTDAMDAIERAVASVTDAADSRQTVAAVRSVSPALVDDVVFGIASSTQGGTADGILLGVGVAASPGIGVGRVAIRADAAVTAWEAGTDVVLLVDETGPADETAIRVASAIVTRRGGIATHAAIVARQWGVPAVCGIGALDVAPGSAVLVDGSTGEVRLLDAETDDAVSAADPPATAHHGPLAELPAALATLLGWADVVAAPRMSVLANADLAADAQVAVDLGARGIGLCRTEHQFLGESAAIVARVLHGDHDAIVELVERQRSDIRSLLDVMAGRPVRVRLLDAPRHEFDSSSPEHNPMLGVRGVRLGAIHPRVLEAQCEAIAHAAGHLTAVLGTPPDLAVMVPMVSIAGELAWARHLVHDTFFRIGLERGVTLAYEVGAMIETPRAAVPTAPALVQHADFFSFGTNDLTQLTYGLSRDDVDAELLPRDRELGYIDRSPFETLDGSAVVRLMALAAETGRGVEGSLPLGMCGEHGSDPASISIALQLGLSTVSVPPYRVPATRLAVAHAVSGPSGGHPSGSGGV